MTVARPRAARGRRDSALLAVLRETLAYRNLLLNLVVRDLKVRYKGSVLGFAWSFLNPLLMMVVFTIVFVILRAQDVGSYPVFVLTGLLAWNLLAGSVSGAARSITGNANLIGKVYFPRELLPISHVASNLINFVLSLLVLFVIAGLLGVFPRPTLIYLPLILATQLILTTGLALLTAALNVYYRDTELVLDVALIAWFFLTPVFYQLELLPNPVLSLNGWSIDGWRLVYLFNPMSVLVQDYRYVLWYNLLPMRHTLTALLSAVAVLGAGWYVFRRLAPAFGEEL